MLYSLEMSVFLLFHLIGAVGISLLVFFALAILIQKKSSLYRFSALAIAFGAIFESISGSILALQTQGTILAFCARIGLYLFVLLLVESGLFLAMKRRGIIAPLRPVASSFILSIVICLVTGILLVR